eukprot:2290080-Pyramimonas_sp.AAC.1
MYMAMRHPGSTPREAQTTSEKAPDQEILLDDAHICIAMTSRGPGNPCRSPAFRINAPTNRSEHFSISTI